MVDIAQELPKRLQAQRKGLGYTQRQLAERAGLKEQDLQQFETGQRLPYFHELSRVGWALGINPMALLAESQQVPRSHLSSARFRAQADADISANDRRLLLLAAEMGRIGFGLWSLLKWPPCKLRVGCTGLHDQSAPWEQGYTLGAEARRKHIPGNTPIIGLKRVVEDLGVHVAWVRFEDPKIEGATLVERNALPVILLNVAAPRVQQPRTARAILAHELCHVLHDGNHKANPSTSLSYAHEGEGDLPSRLEQRANGFAPSFLAPGAYLNLEKFADSPDGAFRLARSLVEFWSFSVDGAAWHTKNLLKLTHEQKSGLLDELKRLHLRPLRFEESAPKQPMLAAGLVERLARQAHEQEEITEGRLVEILELT